MDPVVLVVVVVLAALLFDFTNGWNDSANAIATVVSTRVLSPTTAVLWSATLNFIGSLVSLKVAKTVGGGMVNLPAELASETVVLAAMLSAAAWVAWCTRLGLPISASHSLFGGMVGSAVAVYGLGGVVWPQLVKILVALVISPLLGMVLGFVFLTLIYSAAVGFRSGRVRAVTLSAAIAFLVGAAGLLLGLDATGVLPFGEVTGWFQRHGHSAVFWFVIPIFGVAFGAMFFLKGLSQSGARRWFGPLQILSSSFMAFEHGKNDAQKVMGVIALALFLGGYLKQNGVVITNLDDLYVPMWVRIACGMTIALGTAVGGWRVIRTLGSKLAHITPADGFVAETAGGLVLEMAAELGIPVSTTHTITGAILGVGTAKQISAVKWGLGAKIVYAWIFTLPACIVVGMLFSITASQLGPLFLVTVVALVTAFILFRDKILKTRRELIAIRPRDLE